MPCFRLIFFCFPGSLVLEPQGMLGSVSGAGRKAFPQRYAESANLARSSFRCIFTFDCGWCFNSQVMERAHYWYYMLELGFYVSLLLRISVDIRRKVKTSMFLL